MMKLIRLSTLWLSGTMTFLFTLLIYMQEDLRLAHADESIHLVSSDAGTYFKLYTDLYAQLALSEAPGLFLIGSPILFMKLTDGNLLWIQLVNLALMGVSLMVAFNCFNTLHGRLTFMLGALVMPYFVFGFLSLNKEIYAMCSAIFFGRFLVRGERYHLVWALILAACARYYMLIAFLTLYFAIPHQRSPRYGLIAAILLCISILAPLVKQSIPEYTTEGLLDDSGALGLLVATIIDHFGYALVYPIKYIALLPTRAYAFLIGASDDTIGGVVSVVSIVMFIWASYLFLCRSLTPLVRRLIVAGYVAPIPIMWTEIMHWRYFSFVYFFFLYAAILHMEQRAIKINHNQLAKAVA